MLMLKIKRRQQGLTILSALLFSVIILASGFTIYAYFNNPSKKGKAFAETFHTDMRTKSTAEVYPVMCPGISMSSSQFSELQSLYVVNTTDSMDWAVTDPVIDMDDLLQKTTSSLTGSFAKELYESGNSQVGLILKRTSGSFCVVTVSVKPVASN